MAATDQLHREEKPLPTGSRPHMALLRPDGISDKYSVLEVNRTIAGSPCFLHARAGHRRDVAVPEAVEVARRAAAYHLKWEMTYVGTWPLHANRACS